MKAFMISGGRGISETDGKRVSNEATGGRQRRGIPVSEEDPHCNSPSKNHACRCPSDKTTTSRVGVYKSAENNAQTMMLKRIEDGQVRKVPR